jgi:hypothetical protein
VSLEHHIYFLPCDQLLQTNRIKQQNILEDLKEAYYIVALCYQYKKNRELNGNSKHRLSHPLMWPAPPFAATLVRPLNGTDVPVWVSAGVTVLTNA